VAVAGACVPGSAQTHAPQIQISTYGGDSGDHPFDRERVRSIGFRNGMIVDALILNGVQHGNQAQNDLSPILVFDDDEYITDVNICTSHIGGRLGISRLIFKTNKLRSVQTGGCSAGDPGNKTEYDLTHVKVLSIGGASGAWLDRIQIEYEIP